VPIAEIGDYRPRAPDKPIMIGSLAGAAVSPNQIAKDSFA